MAENNREINDFLELLDNPNQDASHEFKKLKDEIANNPILQSIVLDILKREYIYNYIYGNKERAINSKSIFQLFSIDIVPNMVLTIIYDNFWMIYEKENNSKRYELKRRLIDAVDKLLENEKYIATTLIGTDKVIVLLDCGKRTEAEALAYTKNLARSLISRLKFLTNHSVSIGISSYKSDQWEIHQAYEESFRALDSLFKTGQGSLVSVEDYKSLSDENLDFYKYLHDLLITLGHGDKEKSLEIIDEISQFLIMQNFDQNYIKSLAIIIVFESVSYFNFDDDKSKVSEDLTYYISNILSENSIFGINKIFSAYFSTLIKRLEDSNSIKRGINISKAYIDKYYMLDISLEKISYVAGFSPYYFSRNFKDKVGLNFIDYLMQTRIDQAKILLKTTDLKISEVSMEVGFDSVSYFSESFKKQTGQSPSAYRSSLSSWP